MMVSAMGGGVLLVALLIGSGAVGELSFAARTASALLMAIAAVCLCWRWHACRTAVQLDISGSGQIRLQKRHGVAGHAADEQAELLTLLPASTIWSSLLILHLQNAQRQTEVVLILRDSVSPETFNALLVACRWLVMRGPETETPGARQN